MTHKPFDDEQLEHVLNNAPKLSDHRSKEDILNRLMADARLQDNSYLQEAIQQPKEDEQKQSNSSIREERTTRSKLRKMPIFMSIAAVFALTILVGSMVMNNDVGHKDQASTADTATYSTLQEDLSPKEAATQDEALQSPIVAEHERMLSLRSSVYEEDVKDAVVFRIGLAGRDAESVPMTYVIPNERVATDFGTEKPSTLQMYEKYAPQIDEKAKGFTDYHPYKGELKEKDDKLVHVLPKDNSYDVASATVNEYKGTLEDTFSDSEYTEVEIQNEDGTPYEFSQEGEPSPPMSLTNAKHYNYYIYQDGTGAEYLSPDFRQTFANVTEALTLMKNKNDDVYVSVVPENVSYTVTEEAEGVVVTFDLPLDLTSMEPIRATQLIEAMMLTAASFDQQLRLNNVVQESWEGFDLKMFLPKPVGPNKQYMP